MLTRPHLAGIARREGVPLHAVERDYVQHVFLRHAGSGPLVFKGGTCLRIVHGSPRHSEDLDFNGPDRAGALAHVETAAARLADYGMPASLRPVDSREGLQARLRYEGPLFDGTDRSRGSIRIEVSLRGEAVEAEPAFVPRTPYADVPQLVLLVTTREHLLAEKVRALLTRRAARDLYDVHFLLTRDVSCPRSLLDAKMARYGRRFTVRALDESVRATARTWERDLGPLLGQVPPYARVAGDVRTALRTMAARGPRRRGT